MHPACTSGPASASLLTLRPTSLKRKRHSQRISLGHHPLRLPGFLQQPSRSALCGERSPGPVPRLKVQGPALSLSTPVIRWTSRCSSLKPNCFYSFILDEQAQIPAPQRARRYRRCRGARRERGRDPDLRGGTRRPRRPPPRTLLLPPLTPPPLTAPMPSNSRPSPSESSSTYAPAGASSAHSRRGIAARPAEPAAAVMAFIRRCWEAWSRLSAIVWVT